MIIAQYHPKSKKTPEVFPELANLKESALNPVAIRVPARFVTVLWQTSF